MILDLLEGSNGYLFSRLPEHVLEHFSEPETSPGDPASVLKQLAFDAGVDREEVRMLLHAMEQIEFLDIERHESDPDDEPVVLVSISPRRAREVLGLSSVDDARHLLEDARAAIEESSVAEAVDEVLFAVAHRQGLIPEEDELAP